MIKKYIYDKNAHKVAIWKNNAILCVVFSNILKKVYQLTKIFYKKTIIKITCSLLSRIFEKYTRKFYFKNAVNIYFCF